MEIIITKVPLTDLGELRQKFLEAFDNQFTYDKCHRYGWADTWLFKVNDLAAGYGSVWGKENRKDRDSIFEFYLEPSFRKDAHEIFGRFVDTSKVQWIECQSNDQFLSEMFFEFAIDIYAEAILFKDDFESAIVIDGASLKPVEVPGENRADREYVLTSQGEVVGKGGLMLNYNFPFADIYYEIDEKYRRHGLGGFFVQELKREAYRIGRVPAARTNVNNLISKRTMMKAGLKPCGWRLGGKIRSRL